MFPKKSLGTPQPLIASGFPTTPSQHDLFCFTFLQIKIDILSPKIYAQLHFSAVLFHVEPGLQLPEGLSQLQTDHRWSGGTICRPQFQASLQPLKCVKIPPPKLVLAGHKIIKLDLPESRAGRMNLAWGANWAKLSVFRTHDAKRAFGTRFHDTELPHMSTCISLASKKSN